MHEGSYNDIRHGMPVVSPDGEIRARVDEVLYDEASDIFVGLVISHERLLNDQHLFVPGEHVTAVRGGEVFIDQPLAELKPYVSPAEKFARAHDAYEKRGPLDNLVT